MKTQQIFTGAMALAVGLVVSGCSGGKFLSPGRLFNSASSQTASRSAEDPAARSELALARLNERRGQIEYAERLYLRLIKKDPEHPVPHHRLAVMRAQQGRFQEANEHFDQALRFAPSDAKLLRDVGYCYYLEHRLDEAEEMLRRALELKPNDPAICNNLGVLFGEQGRDRACLAMFRRTGTEAQSHANMAFVYAQRGELEKAKASYGRALTLDQKLKPAAEALVQIAQYEQPIGPPPSAKPVPRADSQLADKVPSAPKKGAEIVRPQMPQTVGPLVASTKDESGFGSAMVTDSAQPISFEQVGPGTGPEALFAAPYPKMSGSGVDFADALGSLVSQPKN